MRSDIKERVPSEGKLTPSMEAVHLARLWECQFILFDFKPYVDNDSDNDPNEIKDHKRSQIGFDYYLISMQFV